MSAEGTGGGEAGAERPAILLVDDENALIEPMQALLESEYEVESAGSGEEAEIRLGLRAFDLVVCDHLMPGELGVDFLMRMRERFPRMKRVLITGYMNPELISRGTQLAGLSACLLKPIRPRELLAEVRRVLAG